MFLPRCLWRFLVRLWNAAAPPSDGEEGSFCAVEMSRLQDIKGKALVT